MKLGDDAQISSPCARQGNGGREVEQRGASVKRKISSPLPLGEGIQG
jgi:hypothetical protein